MAIAILLAVWTPYVVMRLLHAQHARAPSLANPQLEQAKPPAEGQADTISQDQPGWTALDDRQLIRLLTDSAPRTPPNRGQL